VLIVVATSFQGMSVGTLVWGVILNPLNQPNIFFSPLDVSRLNFLVAIIVTAGVIGVRLSQRSLAAPRWFNVLRCAAGIGSLLLLLRYQIQWVVPLLPLTLIPASDWERDTDALFPRLFVTYMAATQFLEAYPIAESQVGIAAAPMILWAFLCIADGIAGLRTLRSLVFFGEDLRLDAVIGGAIIIFLTGASIVHSANSQFPPASTGLRGSAWLHLPAEQVAQFEPIARNVRKNCSTLFTMPGMGSFNLWSGIPPPNGWNMTGWMKGISSERQAEILSIMKADPQSCAILNRSIVRVWDDDEVSVAELPLAHYVMADMPMVIKFGEYEIRVHPKRGSPWLE
jgi:hypothetical protein